MEEMKIAVLIDAENICTPEGCIFYGVDNGTRTHDLQSHNLTP